jgi:hypothetical protein
MPRHRPKIDSRAGHREKFMANNLWRTNYIIKKHEQRLGIKFSGRAYRNAFGIRAPKTLDLFFKKYYSNQ